MEGDALCQQIRKKYIILTIFTASMIAIVSSITAFFTETEYHANNVLLLEK